jgi:hypothetical protein
MNPTRKLRPSVSLLLTVICCFVAPPATAGEKPNVKETTKSDVQGSLRDGWDKVVYGKELDHAEYLKILAAAAASVATENPTPLTGYAKDFATQSLQSLGTALTTELVLTALANPDKIFTSGGMEISAGVATYHHKRVVGFEVPDRVEIDGLKVTVRKRMEWVVIDLPNTFQPYVRIRTKK